MRDYRPTDTIVFHFSTNTAAGVAATASGTVALYKDGGAVGSSLGITLSPDDGGEVGKNKVTIVGATALLTPGSDYMAYFEGLVDGVATKQVVREFSVMNQGADVVSRGQLAAVTASGGTLAAGTFARAKAGDAVRILTGASVDYRVMDTLNLGTGVFTLADPWETAPAVGDYYDAVALPRAEKIKAADIADDAISAATLAADAVTAIQTGLATAAAVAAVDVNVDSVLGDTGAIGAMLATVDGIVDTIVADTANLKTRVPAALVAGKMDAALNAAGLDAGAVAAITAALFTEADSIEAGLNMRDALRLAVAVLVGLTAGIQDTTTLFKSADLAGGAVAGSKTRISATRAADSDRLAVTVDLT